MTMARQAAHILSWQSMTRPDAAVGEVDCWSKATQEVKIRTAYEFRISQRDTPGRITVEILHQDQLAMVIDGHLLDHAEVKELCECVARVLDRRQRETNGQRGATVDGSMIRAIVG